MTAAARTAALSSRGIEPWPHVPRDRDAVGREALLGDLDRVEAPPGDRHRDAAAFVERARPPRSQSGRCSAIQLAPAMAAGLLVGGGGEQDVAAQAGDRVAGGIEAGGARLGREQPDDAELHRDHAPSCRPRRARRCSRRRGRPRTGRGSSARAGRARRRGARAGAAARRPCRRRAGGRGRSPRPGHRLDDLGLEAGRDQAAPRCGARRAARRRARPGDGGLIEGIRMSARSVSTSSSTAFVQRRLVDLLRRRQAARASQGAPEREREGDADDEAADHEHRDHPEEQAQVLALLAKAGLGVRVGAADDVPGRAGRASGRSCCAPSRRRSGRAGAGRGTGMRRSWRHHAAEQRTAQGEQIGEGPEAEPRVHGAHRDVVDVVAGLQGRRARDRSPSRWSRA